MGGMGWKVKTEMNALGPLVLFGVLSLPALPARPASPALPSAQVPFEQAMVDLRSPDAGLRLRTARMLKDAAYPESAVPLAKAILDPRDEVQLESIAAELNIFLAEGRSHAYGAGR